MIQKHKFFNQLTDDNLVVLAMSFAELEDPKYLNSALMAAVKSNDINLLKDKDSVERIVKTFKNDLRS